MKIVPTKLFRDSLIVNRIKTFHRVKMQLNAFFFLKSHSVLFSIETMGGGGGLTVN